MGRSLALGLYLLASRGMESPAPQHARRPEGRLVWLHGGNDVPLRNLAQIARRLARDRGGPTCLVTSAGVESPDLAGFPAGTIAGRFPGENVGALKAFLAFWRPDHVTLLSSDLPPAMIVTVHESGVPLLLAAASMSRRAALSWRWRAGMARSLISRFSRILAADAESAERILSLSDGTIDISVLGPIEETAEAVPCVEAEREALAALVKTRPVWLAAACPEVEEDVVIAAHDQAARLAHRLLLIVVPSDPARGPALAEKATTAGLVAALRSQEEEPDPEVQVLVADTEGELGLWYRLAPVTYLGGSLLGQGPLRNPLEPAALGSAILTGPQTAPHAEVYSRLSRARAVRLVRSGSALSEAVTELIAPDRAALLAHNAWVATTGGAEVTEGIAQAILTAIQPARLVPAQA